MRKEEELITFETAILAKEKGFKEITVYHYGDTRSPMDTMLIRPNEQFGDGNWEGTNWNDEEWCYEKYAAPTQSLLNKWLREQDTPIIVTPLTDFVTWWVEIDHPDLERTIIDKNNGKWINTYEEALEIGLQKGLELI